MNSPGNTAETLALWDNLGPFSMMSVNAAGPGAILVLGPRVGARWIESILRSAPHSEASSEEAASGAPGEIGTPAVVGSLCVGVNGLGSEAAKESHVEEGVLWTSLPLEFGGVTMHSLEAARPIFLLLHSSLPAFALPFCPASEISHHVFVLAH